MPRKTSGKGAQGKVRVTIDLNRLTIGDLEIIDRFRSGDARLMDIVDLLQRAAGDEVDIRSLPLTALPDLVDQLVDAISVRRKN